MVDMDKPSVFSEDPLATSMKSIQSNILMGRITSRAMVKWERSEPKNNNQNNQKSHTIQQLVSV